MFSHYLFVDLKQFSKGIYLVNLLGIVYNPNTKKILIAKRENDPYVNNLTWCFPGGTPDYELTLEGSLKDLIAKRTGVNVRVDNLIFARKYPEKKDFLALYYFCLYLKGKPEPSVPFTDVKWIKPIDVKKYFTTSIDKVIYNYFATPEIVNDVLITTRGRSRKNKRRLTKKG